MTKDTNICRQGFGLHILGCARYFVHWLTWERKNHQLWISYSIIGVFEGRNCQKMATKVFFYQDRLTSRSQQWQNYMNCTSNCFCTHPSDYWLFADLKRMFQGKRFGSNEAVISETEVYFEAKDKWLCKKGIELLEKRWNQCITLEGDYVDEWSRILPKMFCFIF